MRGDNNLRAWNHGENRHIHNKKDYTQILKRLMIFQSGCKTSKVRRKMRLKPYQDPRLPQINVIHSMKPFYLLFSGFLKDLFETAG